MRVYIVGPIAGYPNANRDAFALAALNLQRAGHEVVNPLEVAPTAHEGDCPPGLPGGEGAEHAAPCYMRADLIEMLSCDGIFLLGGWDRSEGARIEYLIAVHVCGLTVLNPQVWYPHIPQPPQSVRVAFGLDDDSVPADPDPTDAEQGPLEQGWALNRREDLANPAKAERWDS